MAYCRNCGAELEDGQEVCFVCGKADKNNVTLSSVDTAGLEWGLLGFFIPVVGLVLYLLWKEERPKTARIAGKGVLISIIFQFILFILYVIFMVAVLLGSR